MRKTKKYLVILVIGIILLMLGTVSKAASVEIDTESKITMPMFVTGGKFSISINSSITNYTLYYQRVEVTENFLAQREAKKQEYDQYVTETDEELATLDQELERLEDIRDTEQTEEAKKNYNDAVSAYNARVTEINKKRRELVKEYNEMFPDFNESKWQKAEGNEFTIDTSDYTGTRKFTVWVKVETNGNTIYDALIYELTGTKQETTITLDRTTAEVEVGKTITLTATVNTDDSVTWSSNKTNIATVNENGVVTGVSEGVATITATANGKSATCTVTVKGQGQGNYEEPDDSEWTDFSNAYVRLARNENYTSYHVVIGGIQFSKNAGRYDIYFSTDKNSVPDIDEKSSDGGWQPLSYTNSSTIFNPETELGVYISNKQYELNGEKIYVWVREKQINEDGYGYTYRMQLSGIEVDRLSQPPLGSRISAYFFDDYTSTYLLDYYNEENKSLKYKIGKITDTNILKAIKNGEEGCIENLMNYAKNATGGYEGECIIGKSDSITNKLNLIDGEYYYVYFELDTENGKYYPIEDVSLYQGVCYYETDGTYSANLSHYLSDNFKWNLGEEKTEEPKDKTTATEKLPNAGKTVVLFLTVMFIATFGIICYRKYKKLEF